MEIPLVSVVLATYNGEAFLAKQLESVFLQSYSPIEVIAVDDGSTDATIQVLNEYAARYPTLKIFTNESNLGFIKNFEKGCRLANGAFIACCDQDDYWQPDKIKKMVAAIGTHPMIYCDSDLCDQDLQKKGTRVSDLVVCQSFNSCLQQAVFCRIYGHATLISKALLDKALPFLDMIPHDWWLSYTATLCGEIQYLPEPLVLYRQHNANLFGVVGIKRKKKQAKREKKTIELTDIRNRMQAFCAACPPEKITEKKVLSQLLASYQNFSLWNNVRRMRLFFRYRGLLLAVKKRSPLRKILFCFKMFVSIK